MTIAEMAVANLNINQLKALEQDLKRMRRKFITWTIANFFTATTSRATALWLVRERMRREAI